MFEQRIMSKQHETVNVIYAAERMLTYNFFYLSFIFIIIQYIMCSTYIPISNLKPTFEKVYPTSLRRTVSKGTTKKGITLTK